MYANTRTLTGNRRIVFFLAGLLALCVTWPVHAAGATVTVLSWEAFISPKVITTFKNREKLVVKLIEFSSAEERDRLLREKPGQIDIVVADTIYGRAFQQRGLLQKLEAKRIPAMRHAMKHWRTGNTYAVPYLWGHTGIAWRTDKVTAPLTSYADLFALAKQNPGKVSLLDDAHEALRAALYAFGKSPWTFRAAADVRNAKQLLKPHRRNIRFVGAELDEDSPWLNGSLIAGQAFNGDIAYLRDTYNAPLAFAIPSPGCMIWHEQLMMLSASANKDAAYRFLALITEPANAARNAESVRYAPSNPLAVARLSDAFRADPIIRPAFDGLDGCYFYEPFDQQTQTALDNTTL
jgi:spermidine/putrescine transport system substrate-binding protein